MINSYGIILQSQDTNRFLLYQRRDSRAYIKLLRDYRNDNDPFKLITQITNDEKQRILTNTFDDLWDDLFLNKNCRTYFTEKRRCYSLYKKHTSLKVFEKLKTLELSKNKLEWGFPKGRINKNELPLRCALREFREETNMFTDDVNVDTTVSYIFSPIENYSITLYKGICPNEKQVIHKYYDESIRKICIGPETNDLKWVPFEDIRIYINDQDLLKFIETNYF
jgi:8-oxo-dGTP pyrophosphatase MutT (NUDIX family)